MKLHTVEAEVHKQYGNGYRVKVMILDLGIYINGMMVYPPNDEHKQWSVLTPARPAGRGKYARIVEFNKKLPLWEHVHDACVDAVKLFQHDSKDTVVDVDMDNWSQEDMKRELDKAFPDD